MTAANPADTALGNLFMGRIVETDPLEVGELTPKLHNGPAHCHTRLSNDCPPMLFALLLLSDAVVRAILAVVNKNGAVLLG